MKNLPNLNLYKGFSDVNSEQKTLSELVTNIRDNAVTKDATDKYRYFTAQGQTAAAGRIKRSMQAFAVAATFPPQGRQQKDITGMTGLIMVDMDKATDDEMARALQRIRADAHTLLCHITVSGHGIRVLACYDLCDADTPTAARRRYARAFAAANAYYARLTGLPTDEQCKNPTRISVLAHDPDAY
jgi:hypothetical protein